MSFVGIIANPASGKDIRRLVAYGSVFDNQEKVRIVRRVLLGLAAVGVERICYMPDYFGIVGRALDPIDIPATVFPTDFPLSGTQDDSTQVARIMEAHRGTLTIESEPGTGTVIGLLVPAPEASDHAKPPSRRLRLRRRAG